MKRSRRLMLVEARILIPEMATLAKRKVVIPPSTQSGMDVKNAAIFIRHAVVFIPRHRTEVKSKGQGKKAKAKKSSAAWRMTIATCKYVQLNLSICKTNEYTLGYELVDKTLLAGACTTSGLRHKRG